MKNIAINALLDNKGDSNVFGLVAIGAIAMVSGGATLYVGMLVNNKISGSIDVKDMSDYTVNYSKLSGWNSSNQLYSNESPNYNSLKNAVLVGFSLVGIGLIVVGAAVILTVVKSGF